MVSGNAVWVCVNAGVYVDASVSGNACVSGAARVDQGNHSTSPLYFQGSRHPITVVSAERVHVGCHCYPLARWLKSYRAVGKKEGYSDKEIEEYGVYFTMVSNILELRGKHHD